MDTIKALCVKEELVSELFHRNDNNDIKIPRNRGEWNSPRSSSTDRHRPLKLYLANALGNESGCDDEDADEDEEPEISFNQWSTTDRAELTKQSTSLSSFVDLLYEQLDRITAYSFIAKAQGQYLRQEKENLNENEAIILVDFAENYKFLVQDEIRGITGIKHSALYILWLYTPKKERKQEQGKLPAVLYIQLDNCIRENKNKENCQQF